ncbi:MAG: ABC transporter permease, partial [Bifidobacteriaceae bacterium]|nr:ABC transporter permease [Bifidobacteriaceae bacterium]
RQRYGLDDPFIVQYVHWLTGVFQGNFGYSLVSQHSIADDLADKVPNTVILVVPAYLAALGLGIGAGLIAGANRGRKIDGVIDTGLALGISMPTFWFALLVIYLFGYWLRWFPIIGMHSVGRTDLPDLLAHLAMPCLVLTVAFFPDLGRYVRSATISQLDQDYVMVQRAYGSPERAIFRRHVVCHVLLPVVTQIGLALPMLVVGAVITETIFAWPGAGRYFLDAIRAMDYPVVMAVLLLASALVIGGNLLADVLYRVVDPRIRLTAATA